jgi:proprotein convertase subtilisin/kexin type 5
VLVNGVCEPCQSGCDVCTSPNVCTKCLPASSALTNIFLQGSRCESQCSTGYHSYQPSGLPAASAPKICCHQYCKTCSGSGINQCLSCNPGFFLDSYNQCGGCDTSCESCNGPNINNCLSCPQNKFLEVGSGLCQDDCPGGFYKNYAQRICSNCHPTCRTCVGKNFKVSC